MFDSPKLFLEIRADLLSPNEIKAAKRWPKDTPCGGSEDHQISRTRFWSKRFKDTDSSSFDVTTITDNLLCSLRLWLNTSLPWIYSRVVARSFNIRNTVTAHCEFHFKLWRYLSIRTKLTNSREKFRNLIYDERDVKEMFLNYWNCV